MFIPTSTLGQRAIDRCDFLGSVPYSEDTDRLNRPYLTESHRNALVQLETWMGAARMSVRVDPMGNLVGRYEGTRPNAPALLIGSHIDSVRDGGRYDGPLGVMMGIECVEAFADRGKRLPFAIEVIAFGDEEGSRFPVSMLCSRALAHGFDESALTMTDEDGLTLQQALYDFGLDPEKAANARRRPGEVFAYLEAHIEQGPVLEAENLPIGVVTGIAAQLRIKARFEGMAGHAGTTPMHLRRDALAAAAAAVLAVEDICGSGPPDLRGTVGRFLPTTTAFNVIAGGTEIGIDIRAGSRDVRDAAAREVKARLETIAAARKLVLTFTVVQDLSGCPCDPQLSKLLDEAVASVGVKPYHLLSGAGHDGMALCDMAPVVMLFLRCEGGISHNAAERVAAPDVEIGTRALIDFVERLGRSMP
ncbi:MAG: allantoate amidohydrolase [Caulobacteraceae bacterium]